MKEELIKFKLFKENYIFNQKEIQEKNGILYCDNYPIIDEEENPISESDTWINIGYKYKGDYSKLLSNLFPYEFEFRGHKLKSIESFFQGLKFKNKDVQELVFNYSGINSNNIKSASDYDWKKTGILYFEGKEINRYSEEYENLIDELYISAIQNPLYRNAIKNCPKDIIHTMGKENKEDTVFTRYEFEKQLNCLKDFLNQN